LRQQIVGRGYCSGVLSCFRASNLDSSDFPGLDHLSPHCATSPFSPTTLALRPSFQRHRQTTAFRSLPNPPVLVPHSIQTVPSLIAIVPAVRSQIRPTTRVDRVQTKTGATHSRHARHNPEQPWTTPRTGIPHIRRPSVPYPCPSNTMPKPRRAAKRASSVSVITSSPRLQYRDL
jgi:hypothetical protein